MNNQQKPLNDKPQSRGLSVSMQEMGSYVTTPKSDPSGHHRINPWTDAELRAKFTEPVAQPHQTFWQKFVTKLQYVWKRILYWFN